MPSHALYTPTDTGQSPDAYSLLTQRPKIVATVILLSLSQGNRDESYDVDEDLAEQDATSLFEVGLLSILNIQEIIMIL